MSPISAQVTEEGKEEDLTFGLFCPSESLEDQCFYRLYLAQENFSHSCWLFKKPF